jgi:hypothetical protein
MKPAILFCILIFAAVFNIRAQGIHFEKDSLPVILVKAKATAKPVMVMLDAPTPAIVNGPQKQREVLNSAEVSKQFQDNFLCVNPAFGSTQAQKLVKAYSVGSYPVFFFFNSEGALVFRTFGLPGTAQSYITTINNVLAMIKNGNNIAAYETRYKAGERSKAFLAAYITAKEHLGFYDNSDLINDYVKQLTLNEINTYDQMRFILLGSPLVGSTAMQLTYMYIHMRDSVYKSQSSAMNSAMNTRIINNSLAKAIATKDRNLAYQTATFAQGTYGKDFVHGQRSNQSNMLTFYKAIKDTTSYLQQAGYFYDGYYMNISVDSAKRQQQKLLDSLKTARDRSTAKYKDSASVRMVYTIRPANAVAQVLNTGAWETYLTRTHNQVYLIKAISWARRSIAIEPGYYNHDTLAHLLYQFGFYADAEAEQEQAIALAKEKKLPASVLSGLVDVQKKIKQRSL